MFYYEIFRALNKNQIKYIIVGGLAVNFHNVPRLTNDIDLLLSMDKENLQRFIELMKELDYTPRLPVEPESLLDSELLDQWIKERNLKAFSFYNKKESYQVIDIVVVHNLDFEKAYERRFERQLNDTTISIVSIEDLIEMKRLSGREHDLNDIEMLEKAKEMMNGRKEENI